MMAKNLHQQWAESQLRALLAIGVDLVEAERAVKWVLDHLPEGADPATWIPTAVDLEQPIDAAAVQDARTDWYSASDVPGKFKRILDAQLDRE